MEKFKALFSTLSKKCCFISDYTSTEREDREPKGSLDITSSQIPQMFVQSKSLILKLKVIESEKMPVGKIFTIEPAGLIDSERTFHGDHCVYAGSLYSENNRVINDIILPQNEQGVGRRHFMIQYKENPNHSYHIKDLGDGMGTFIRITRPLVLKTNYIISFGESHMIVILDNSESPKLALRFIDGPKIDQRFKFTDKDSPISIGRMSDCAIKFDDNNLSRYHCIISLKEENWVIQDGDGLSQSTNGTWLFVEDFFEVHNEMIFKVGESTFKTELSFVNS